MNIFFFYLFLDSLDFPSLTIPEGATENHDEVDDGDDAGNECPEEDEHEDGTGRLAGIEAVSTKATKEPT